MDTGVNVVARDHATVRGLILGQRYEDLRADLGCARQTLSQIAHKPGRQVKLELAGAIEKRFGYRPGGLFKVPGVGDPRVTPYLLDLPVQQLTGRNESSGK